MNSSSQEKFEGTAVSSIACGILSWLLVGVSILLVLFYLESDFIFILGFILFFIEVILWLTAVILGIIALRRLKSNPSSKGRSMAIAGITLGTIPFVIYLLYNIFLILGFLANPFYG